MNTDILVVADSDSQATGLPSLLESLGHRVLDVASEGRQVISMCRELAPDLVLMETGLPGLEGIEAVRVLNLECRLPVMLISPRADAEFLERARRAGIYSYLVQPVDQELLGPAIELALNNFRRISRLEGQVLDLRQALSERKQVEKAKGLLMERLGLSESGAGQRLEEQARQLGLSLAKAAKTVIASG